MALNEEHTDPTLYFVGAWKRLVDTQRDLVRNTRSPDGTVQNDAWHALLAEPDLLPLAIAVDQAISSHASARMGGELSFDRESLRNSARRLLREPPQNGEDRSHRVIRNATHTVALRALSIAASAEDEDLLIEHLPAQNWNSHLARAWISAATEVLRNAKGESGSALIEKLTSAAIDKNNELTVRVEAVVAISSAVTAPSEKALHHIFDSSETDLRVESGAALAGRGKLTEHEYQFLRTQIESEPKSPILLARLHEIRAGLGEYKRDQ